MEHSIHFQKLNRIFLITLLLSLLAATSVLGQTPAPASPLKLYIDENGRLKQQKVALSAENEALKQALQAENKKAVQLQSSLNQVQPDIDKRDHQLANLQSELNLANQKVKHQELLA